MVRKNVAVNPGDGDLTRGLLWKVLTTLVLTNHLQSSSFKTTVGQFQLLVSYKQLLNISPKAVAAGIPGIKVDGRDPLQFTL